RRYEQRPADLGVVCIRQVVVPTEAEARAVADQIAGGAKIEDLATARSTDKATKAKGGALESTSGGACVPGYDPDQVDSRIVVAGADAAPGDVVGPFQGPGGWYVVQPRPYGEISKDLAALFAQSAGDLLYFGYLTGADVRISPLYGRWDPLTTSVAPL